MSYLIPRDLLSNLIFNASGTKYLYTHSHPPIGTHHTPRTPTPILRAQHAHHPSNLPRKSRSPPPHLLLHQPLLLIRQLLLHHRIPIQHFTQRRGILKPLHLAPERLPGLEVHVAHDGTRVDGVDGGFVGEFARPGPRHGFEGGFCAAVDALACKSQRRRYAGDIHNAAGAAGVCGEVRGRGLGEEEGREDVDVVLPVEIGRVDGAFGGVVV